MRKKPTGRFNTDSFTPSEAPNHHSKDCAAHTVPCCCVGGSAVSDSLWPNGLQPTRLLCPWNSPGKNTGVGSHSLLQGIFLTQGSNPCLLHCRQVLYHLSHQGSQLCLIPLTERMTSAISVNSHCTFELVGYFMFNLQFWFCSQRKP